jgi:hypothetical protein
VEEWERWVIDRQEDADQLAMGERCVLPLVIQPFGVGATDAGLRTLPLAKF